MIGHPFLTLEDMVMATSDSVRPPERITVSEAACRYHMTGGNGVAVRPFDLDKTPYLREPMDELESSHFTGMAFAGPARAGKSVMFLNWLIYLAIFDPANMMLVHMSRDTGREWSQQDLERAITNSTELRKRLMPGRMNDNVFDKRFLSGMRMSVTWPTIKNLSGKTVGKLWIMDMDRIKPQLIDGEAHVFDATRARARTLRSRGMCAAEASPGFDVTDPKWMPSLDRPHEAPPTEGILSIYNRGDRRRWYWECPFCQGKFEPKFSLLRWKQGVDIPEAAASVWMECPHCYSKNGTDITPNMLPELNLNGRWIKEGQIWLPSGDVVGTARRSKIASFWMFGPAAGTVGPENWEHLVTEYLTAVNEYEKTGDEGPLRSTVNLNNGEPYLSKTLEGSRLPETLKARAEDWGGHDENEDPYVPASTRFILATIDVQAGGRPSFVAHYYAIDANLDIWHVHMHKISKSERRDEVTDERHGIDPAAYPEDWDLIASQVMARSFPLPDASGRRIAVKMTMCDSGGADGVTRNAYDFYRRLRSEGNHKRFHLVKGAPTRAESATIRLTLPDSQQKDRFAIARGDVPVWLVNTNIVKDIASNMLGREEPGAMIHFPTWAPAWLYAQLTTEIRQADGQWKNPIQKRNEAFDLLVYCIAALDHPDIRIRFLDWENPPGWAAPLHANDFVFDPAAGSPLEAAPVAAPLSLEEIARNFA